MSNTKTATRFSVGVMTRIAILAAIASILFLIEIPIVAFYKLDLSDIPVLLGAFSMGAVPGLVILALKSAIGLLHSSSAGVGELADFIMGAALVIPAALVDSESTRAMLVPGGRLYDQRKATTEELAKIEGVTFEMNHAAFYLFPRIDEKIYDFYFTCPRRCRWHSIRLPSSRRRCMPLPSQKAKA